MNFLFICSRNKWRSYTAETIYKNQSKHKVKSAGTEPSARIKITENLINWADLIFVMEKKHKARLEERYNATLRSKEIITLDIPDEYKYMDPELIEIIKDSVNHYFED